MWKRLAALISGSILVSSCETVQYKPIICDPGYEVLNGRCAKVPQALKTQTTPARPKRVQTAEPQTLMQQPRLITPRVTQNVY